MTTLDSLIEALRRAQMKLRAYIGVCKDDKELPKVIESVSDALNMLICDCPAHVKERANTSEISVVERCERCGWPIVPEGEAGCWKSNCSMRPMPPLHQPVPVVRSDD